MKKFSKLSITSFVFAIVAPIFLLLAILVSGVDASVILGILATLFFIGSFIISIISLISLRKSGLRGNVLSWIALGISCLFFFLVYRFSGLGEIHSSL